MQGGEPLPRRDGPLLVERFEKKLSRIEPRGLLEADDLAGAQGGDGALLEALGVDDEPAGRAELDNRVGGEETRGGSTRKVGLEGAPDDVQSLVELVGARVGVEVRPEKIDESPAVDPVMGLEGDDLEESLALFAASEPLVRGRPVDIETEGAEKMDVEAGLVVHGPDSMAQPPRRQGDR